MIGTYFKIAFRNFTKEKFYSLINVIGLSVGVAVALIIALFILHESSYDRFHKNADRIFRIASHLEISGDATDLNSSFPGLADALRNEVPVVEQAVRVYVLNGRIFKNEQKVFSEDKVLYADPQFFQVFDFKVMAGNPETALKDPYTVLLTPRLAKRYFNSENAFDVVGQSISINQELYKVTGIIAEAPANSHMTYTAVASIESTPQGKGKDWDNLNLSTYVMLRNQQNISSVTKAIPEVFARNIENYDQFPATGIKIEPIVQALTDIHLYSNLQGEFEPAGSVTNLYIFGSVAIVVLVLASVNFVNLVTARSSNRAKEVGVRKVLGSSVYNLMRQFIIESLMLVLLATLLALGLIELIRIPFTHISGVILPFDLLLTRQYVGWLLLFVLFLGVAAGSYPAFFLSSFRPVQVLKGKLRSGFRSGNLRNALVGVQFVISIVLITCMLIVQRQLDFMRSQKLGFDKENVIVVDNANRLNNVSVFINSLKNIPSVKNAGLSTFRPIDDYDGMLVTTEDDKDNRKLVNFSRIDHEYLSVLKYEFAEGRNFSPEFPSDSAAVVINERAAQFLFGENALGKKLINDIEYTVIGIVKNFNFESLKNEIRPLVFYLHPNQRFLHIRIEPGNYSETIAAIEKAWKEQTSEIPFSYAFLNDTYDAVYKNELKLGFIFNIFTALALLIACLGLVGLAAYMAEQRKKEISVRKVFGASAATIVQLLSRDFIRIILVSLLVALPVAYYLMHQWLKGFAYKVNIPVYVLLAGGVVVLFIALLAVSYQSIRAALVNPVESLKEE
jgi:putative ABC transport system permease protein